MAIRPQGPIAILVHEDGGALSKFQFVAVFLKCLEDLGFSPSDYSSHSFRIGAATEAVRWSLPPEAVKRIGRWESARYKI